jgi:putative selenium metabolism hydrolase
MLRESRRQEIVEFCQTLIRIPSGSGCELDVARAVVDKMCQLGYDEAYVDQWGNAVGHLSPSGPASAGPILFDGHIDNIGVTGEWRHDPFGGEIDGSRLYGRGASDMKGSVAAMVCAAAYAKADGKLQRDVWVSGSGGEEVVEGLAFRPVVDAVKPEWVVIGEASELHLMIGQRGRARIVVETYGVPAHSSTPELGVNAAMKMAGLLLEIGRMDLPRDEFLGEGTLELVELVSSPYPGTSVVPSGCLAQYDRRLLLYEDPESITAPIQRIIDAVAKDDPKLRAEIKMPITTFTCSTGEELSAPEFSPAWRLPVGHPLVQSAAAALRSAGLDVVLDHYRFCTNGSLSAGIGIPTIGFGPGKETLAHIIDEYVDIEDLVQSAAGYYELSSMR